jgi:excisionase family DNA binding protein
MNSHTVHTIALCHGVSDKTVRRWIQNGELKAINVGRNPNGRKPRWRISQSALDAFLAARTTSGPSVPRAKGRKQSGNVISFY